MCLFVAVGLSFTLRRDFTADYLRLSIVKACRSIIGFGLFRKNSVLTEVVEYLGVYALMLKQIFRNALDKIAVLGENCLA